MSNPSEEVMKLARETVRNLSAFDEKVNEGIIARAIMADRVSCQARVEELERALKPFADQISNYEQVCEQLKIPLQLDDWEGNFDIALGDLRLARSTLEGK